MAAIIVLLIISRFIPDSTTKTSVKPTVGIGEVLQTDYFDVTINNASVDDEVITGNSMCDIHKQPGNKFIILDVTFVNTDKESRMLADGTLIINSNGQEYTYEHPETILLEGWGLFLNNINPLTSMTTKIVYKIPESITGIAYYRPGRADDDERIVLGKL